MKAKITMTVEWEYEVKPESYYQAFTSDQERLNYDIKAIKDDPWLMLETGEWTTVEIKGQLIEKEATHG